MTASTRTARAAIALRPNEPLEIRTIDVDPPGPAEVRLRVVATGICLSVWNGTLRGEFPLILGHEAAGIVEAVGRGVDDVKVGDAVIAALTPACGVCEPCSKGRGHLCVETLKTIGAGTMLDGTNRLRLGSTPLRRRKGRSEAEVGVAGRLRSHVISLPRFICVERASQAAAAKACGKST
jgi:Zn-dependent alcohol dehydrogenase